MINNKMGTKALKPGTAIKTAILKTSVTLMIRRCRRVWSARPVQNGALTMVTSGVRPARMPICVPLNPRL